MTTAVIEQQPVAVAATSLELRSGSTHGADLRRQQKPRLYATELQVGPQGRGCAQLFTRRPTFNREEASGGSQATWSIDNSMKKGTT